MSPSRRACGGCTRSRKATDPGHRAIIDRALRPSCVQAMEINGHLPTRPVSIDPLVEDVIRGLNAVFVRLSSAGISMEPYGDPDTNANGIGIQVTDGQPIYQGGMVMDAIAASGETEHGRECRGGWHHRADPPHDRPGHGRHVRLGAGELGQRPRRLGATVGTAGPTTPPASGRPSATSARKPPSGSSGPTGSRRRTTSG